MFGLVRKLFWFAFFVAATIGFVVLFEHGTQDFVKNYQNETQTLIKLVQTKPKKAQDNSDVGAR